MHVVRSRRRVCTATRQSIGKALLHEAKGNSENPCIGLEQAQDRSAKGSLDSVRGLSHGPMVFRDASRCLKEELRREKSRSCFWPRRAWCTFLRVCLSSSIYTVDQRIRVLIAGEIVGIYSPVSSRQAAVHEAETGISSPLDL